MANPHSLYGEIPLGTGYSGDTHSEMHGRALGLWHNVQAYGALGDGVTDDTQAFLDCIDAANSVGNGLHSIFVPPGTYMLDELEITSMQNFKWQGAGPRSMLRPIGDNPIFKFVAPGLFHNNSFSHLRFQGVAAPGPNQQAFVFEGAPFWHFIGTFRLCDFVDMRYAFDTNGSGVEVTGTFFDRCEFENAPVKLDSDNAMNTIGFINRCRFASMTQNLVCIDINPNNLTNPTSVVLRDTVFEGNDRGALRARSVLGLVLDNVYTENNNLDGIPALPIFDIQNCYMTVRDGTFNVHSAADDELQFGSTGSVSAYARFTNPFFNWSTPANLIDRTKFPGLSEFRNDNASFATETDPGGVSRLTDIYKVRIGAGTIITNHISQALANWNPGAIPDGSFANQTFTVTGATEGNIVNVTSQYNNWVQVPGMWFSAWVSAADQITVTLHNESGGPVTPTNPTVLRADIWKH